MKPRICVPIIGSRGWLGGVSYLENLIKSVRLLPDAERPPVYLYLDDYTLEALDLHAHFLPLFDDLIYQGAHRREVSEALGRPVPTFSSWDELYQMIDFFFLAPENILASHCSASWIPDFQHVHLPEFFHPDEQRLRDRSFKYKAEHARVMVMSSRDAERDFLTLFPHSSAQTRILSFHTLPEESWLKGDSVAIQQKYELPDNFLICCNQFWIHKNHVMLFNALSMLRDKGETITLVCTGSTTDYRCQGYFDEIRRHIGQLGITEQVRILGNIPRGDQIQLVRRSMAVVQPSLFEGWSTVIEDARSLGKTLILSDLAVHREQSPDFAVYFDRNDPTSLAAAISRLLPLLQPGPNVLRERMAATAARRLVEEYGRTFCSIARDTCQLFGRQ